MIVLEKGNGPLILCLPSSGTQIPPAIGKHLSATGRLQTDISWHLDRLLDLAVELDATVIRSTISRYVIDVDQFPWQAGAAESQHLSELCPTTTYDQKRLYQQDQEPGPVEIEQRRMLFYDPFHSAVRQEIDRLRRMHETVLMFDCKSIRSKIKGYMDTELPVINLGSANGQACHPDLCQLMEGFFRNASMSVSLDDFFSKGYITDTYGNPKLGVNVLKLVIAQRCYVRHETPPFELERLGFKRLKTTLGAAFASAIRWAASAPDTAGTSDRDLPTENTITSGPPDPAAGPEAGQDADKVLAPS